ncbi:MAG: amidohydrolase [Acidobacteria bacterium]|nr:amidohydrolase [Acidobacteriota bacterium]
MGKYTADILRRVKQHSRIDRDLPSPICPGRNSASADGWAREKGPYKTSRPEFLLLGFSLLLFSNFTLAQGNRKPDTIIIHGNIYTVDLKQPRAEALAIESGRITAVGSDQQIQALARPSTQTLDARKHLVLPGFTDCHIHFMDGSLGLDRVDLNGADSVSEIQQRVKTYAAGHPDKPWILGMGWTYPVFAPSGLPNKKVLDEVVPDRPVFLIAYDGHSSWANSKALDLAGITRDRADPPNGRIVRDGKGEASGALLEHAGDLVEQVTPNVTREERLQALRKGIHEANRVGLTRVHSAGQDFEYLDLYDELRNRGELSLRLYIAYFLDPPELTPDALEKISDARTRYHDDWISGGVVKTMLDGVVEAHTAAMLEPYSDDPSQLGQLFWNPDKYRQAILELDRRGLQIFTHAIGTKAVRLALDAYEGAADTNHTRDRRHRVEHIETITAQDIPRFGELGVVASMQPLHSYPDDDTLKIWARNAGPDRSSRAWPWKSIERGGGTLAFGSDWPVVTLNPWPGVQTAVTRQTREGNPPGGWIPQERISLEEAIRAYTLNAAFAGHREKTEGSLEPGKLADLIVLSKDLFTVPARDLSKTEVMLTMVGGKVVYEAPTWADRSGASGGHP